MVEKFKAENSTQLIACQTQLNAKETALNRLKLDNKAASNGGSRQAVHGQGCKSQEILIEWRDFYGLDAVSIL